MADTETAPLAKLLAPTGEPVAQTASARGTIRSPAVLGEGHRADAGAAWGTLIHGLLEHAMRYPNATREDLRRLAMWLTVEEPQLRVAIDQAIDNVQRVATADFWAQAKAGVHFEETPFIVAHGSDLMAGVIDLLYESAGGWQVRDYKTDVSLEPSAYAGQLKAYRLALEAVKCRVADASLVHVRETE